MSYSGMTENPTSRFPTVPQSLDSIVKPEELVDVVEMTPLTLHDRRTYNLLLGNAWNDICKRKQHTISRGTLMGYVDSKNQDIPSTLRNLMASIVVVKIRHNENGRPETRQIPLLGPNAIEERGPIKYSFPQELLDIIEKTQIFARIHTEVMFSLSSKYSLALYEWMQKRINLRYKNSETLSVDEFRAVLNVEKGKLVPFGNFNKYAIKPAIQEVNFLTEYDVEITPVKTGRATTHITVSWQKKGDIGSQIAAVEELERSKIGRKARMDNQVEQTLFSPDFPQITNSSDAAPLAATIAAFPKQGAVITTQTLDKARDIVRESGCGLDFYNLHAQFSESMASGKFIPDNINGAFIGFIKKKIKEAA